MGRRPSSGSSRQWNMGAEHLEDGVAREVGRPVHRRDDPFERRLLMRDGPQHRLAHPPDELVEARLAGELAAQRHRAGEQADATLELGAVAPGRGDADDDVVLAAVAAEQLEVDRQQRRERGRPGSARIARGRPPRARVQAGDGGWRPGSSAPTGAAGRSAARARRGRRPAARATAPRRARSPPRPSARARGGRGRGTGPPAAAGRQSCRWLAPRTAPPARAGSRCRSSRRR